MAGQSEARGNEGKEKGDHGDGVFHVNQDRHGRVDAKGEELSGENILARVDLSADRYELFTEVGGRIGEQIPANKIVAVKPGDHFRATIKGTDYSVPGSARS